LLLACLSSGSGRARLPSSGLIVLGGGCGPPPAAAAVADGRELRKQLSALRASSDWDGAHGLLWWALREAPSTAETIHCNIVLAALSDAAEWERALVLLEHMHAAGLPRDGYSFSSAICACARAGQPEAAVETFKAMCADDSVEPSSIAFNTALSAAQRAPDPVRAAEMVLAIYTLETLSLQPDAWASAAALRALTRLGQRARALELYASLRPEQVSPHTLAAALAAAGPRRDPTALVRMYEAAAAEGVPTTKQTLHAALAACAAHPSLGGRRALQLLRAAPASAADDHCYSAAIRAFASSGETGEAGGRAARDDPR